MDEMDKIILLSLASNARMPYQTIARKLGVSSNAVKKRVDRLVEMGVIVDFIVELSLGMFNGEMKLVLLTTDGSEDEQEFCDMLGENPMIGVVGPGSSSTYMVFATHVGSEGLSELSNFVRSQRNIEEVHFYPILYPKGKKVHFTKSHLRVLGLLSEDARMKVEEISKRTNFAPRTVRRLINEIIESEGVRIGLMWDLNAGDSIGFILRVEWHPERADASKVMQLLSNFPEYYMPIISATEPVIFATFVVSNVKDIDRIVSRIKSDPSIKNLVTYLGKKSRVYPDLRNYELQELIAGATRPK
ncbi:MAG: winged helix-turn-helix transcriptional regulator [Candidatus Thorarchaeota archaeon]